LQTCQDQVPGTRARRATGSSDLIRTGHVTTSFPFEPRRGTPPHRAEEAPGYLPAENSHSHLFGARPPSREGLTLEASRGLHRCAGIPTLRYPTCPVCRSSRVVFPSSPSRCDETIRLIARGHAATGPHFRPQTTGPMNLVMDARSLYKCEVGIPIDGADLPRFSYQQRRPLTLGRRRVRARGPIPSSVIPSRRAAGGSAHSPEIMSIRRGKGTIERGRDGVSSSTGSVIIDVPVECDSLGPRSRASGARSKDCRTVAARAASASPPVAKEQRHVCRVDAALPY
jgi:hypothetical protein